MSHTGYLPLLMAGNPILAFAASFCLAFASNWLLLIPWRKSAGGHWTERARRIHPARVAGNFNLWLISVDSYFAMWALFRPAGIYLPFIAIAAWLGAQAGYYPGFREVSPGLRFGSWYYQSIGWGLARLGILFPILGANLLMPSVFDWRAAVIAAGVFCYILLLNWGLLMRLWRGMRLLRPANGRLQQIVEETSRRMGVPPPRTWILSSVWSYAAAMITTRELIFSERLLQLHPDEEVAAICAHELGHLTESRAVVIGRVAGSFTLYPLIFVVPTLATFGLPGLGVLAAIIFVAVILVRRLARRMEERADAGARTQQTESGVYARALERLYCTNQVPAVMRGKRQMHPHLYDRMLAAGVTPDYPRPGAPKLMPVLLSAGLLYGLFFAALLGY